MSESWQESLAGFVQAGTALVGIGNRLRGDDAWGPMVIEGLWGKVPWVLMDTGETPENYIGKVVALGPRNVLLLDAVRWGGAPGSLSFFLPHELPYGGTSTHWLSLRLLSEMVSLRAGCAVALLGVEPNGVEMAAPLSAEARTALGCVVGEFLELARARAVGG